MSFSSFFSNLQEAPWYRSFLNPVINEINDDTTLLDIGTGSGKMIQILSNEKM
jgi:ubiquinone/menaquinone biosynthesis C-methylase UbiE